MNRNEILRLFDGVEDEYVLEAIESRIQRKMTIRKTRYLLIAALIALAALLVGCGIVYTLSLYNSPREMIASIFGDRTGFDHRGVTTVTAPEDFHVPPTELPAYDRVPVDIKVVDEVTPHISSVGQSMTLNGVTMTVDACLYDSKTGCGVLTYVLHYPSGLPEYQLTDNGELLFTGEEDVVPFINQFGSDFLILEKSTDSMLALKHYFMYDSGSRDSMYLELQDRAFRQLLRQQCMEQVRAEYTPEEALDVFLDFFGEDYFDRERFADYVVPPMETRVDFAYGYLTDLRLEERLEEESEHNRILLDLNNNSDLKSVSIGGGAGMISPMSLQLDARKFSDLQDPERSTPRIFDYYSLVIRYHDGTEYMIEGDGVDNRTFVRNAPPSDAENIPQNFRPIHTVMFNRLIDAEQVESVVIDGIIIPKD